MRILLVDDSEVVRERLKVMLLESTKIESISEASNPTEGMEAFRQFSPDVVILDIRMPSGSGIDLLQQLRKSEQPPLIIVLTNYPYPQYRRKCMAAGANFFFDKSTEFNKVTEIVKRWNHNSKISNRQTQ